MILARDRYPEAIIREEGEIAQENHLSGHRGLNLFFAAVVVAANPRQRLDILRQDLSFAFRLLWKDPLALRGLIASQLYGVGPLDPTVILAVTAVLALASLSACFGPARRAARVDPVTALSRQ
jgi:ABC-type antimicrobial peptide transport system permease subunit